MALHYSTSNLTRLNNNFTPYCLNSHKDFETSRRPSYVHRGSQLKFIYNYSSVNSILCLWTQHHTPTSSLHHRNIQHMSTDNLQTQSKYSQPLRKHFMKLAMFTIYSVNNKTFIFKEIISDNNVDILCLPKAWQNPRTTSH